MDYANRYLEENGFDTISSRTTFMRTIYSMEANHHVRIHRERRHNKWYYWYEGGMSIFKNDYTVDDYLRLQRLLDELGRLPGIGPKSAQRIAYFLLVILVVGVNGVGKTTTIGKLAWQFKQAGKKVYLGAADTFRAAAVEQLCIWGERVGVPVIKQQMGSDPASVAFDAISSAKANNADVVLIDTAGRLHNKVGLMNELKKIKDVMKKVMPEAPDEVMLVLDGSTGQNAFEQAKQFSSVTQITSLAITKLDGTAKGGVVIGISDQLKVPVKYIGLGEGVEDLQLFNKREFVDSLFNK